MRDELTDKQIEFYRTNGFIVVEDFLDPNELEEWRRCTDEAVAERLGEAIDFRTNQMDPDTFYAQVFTQCLRLADTHEGMRKLIFDRRIGRMGATLAGVEGIRIWHDQALIKPPHGNPTAWHLDVPYWSFDSPNAISFWMMRSKIRWSGTIPGQSSTRRQKDRSLKRFQTFSRFFAHLRRDAVGTL